MGWLVCERGLPGVYAIMHVSGAGYVGGSARCVYNRLTWHRHRLINGLHTCKALQDLWSATQPDEWHVEVLDADPERETFWMGHPKVLLNTIKDATGKTRRWSEATKQKMRDGRARYLADNPEAHHALAEKARHQHREGKLGRQTWKAQAQAQEAEAE
jgi:hypothetical protein